VNDHRDTDPVPSDAELAAASADLEAALGDLSLNDPAIWIQPSAQLEERVMANLTGDGERPAVTVAGPRRSLSWWVPASVAAAVIALVAVASLRPAAPDWTVVLAATENAVGVEATASGWNEASGTRVELDIRGLEAAPEGFFYECWFSNGPVHISAGTFREPGEVTLWAAVRRAEFPRVWVTLEPIDDNPNPGLNLLDTET
jgi:hypothetical protein